MGAGRNHEVLKSTESISKMSIFFKEAQFEQTSRLRPKPPPIPQYSPMGGLTCNIGRGFGRSLEHGFISTSKLVVKLYYRNAAISLHFIQVSAKCDKNEQTRVFCLD